MNNQPNNVLWYLAAFLLSLNVLLFARPVIAQDADTAAHYAEWRDRVVQIQVIDLQSGQKAGIGSGFFSGEAGWVVSNYHVISELVNQPGRYQARFLAEGNQSGPLKLLAVDAVHDLALLKTDGLAPAPLPLAVEDPPKGSRVWSMGYPFDIGLTIVEGTFNGLLEKSLYEKIHFTGSINPGMSGGPALNAAGEVVGVNVSTAGNQVSFLVPYSYVAELLSSAAQPDPESFNEQLANQLLQNQEAMTSQLLNAPAATTRLNGFEVPGGMADYISCWGNSSEEDDDELAAVYYRCETQDDIYLSASLSTGIIQFQHDLVSSETLHPQRFYKQLQNQSFYPPLRLYGEEDSVTNYRCRSDFVKRDELKLKVTFCTRAYRKLEGLYDGYMEAVSLNYPQQSLKSSLLMAGFSWENLVGLSERFVETLSLETSDE